MCGFFAIFQSNAVFELDAAQVAAESIAHRGPDEAGRWSERHVILFHRRLSIIDLATGQQPMLSGDGRFVIVFNGEIYNFPELREMSCEKRESNFGHIRTQKSCSKGIAGGGKAWSIVSTACLPLSFGIARNQWPSAPAIGWALSLLCWAVSKGALIVSSTLEPFKKF